MLQIIASSRRKLELDSLIDDKIYKIYIFHHLSCDDFYTGTPVVYTSGSSRISPSSGNAHVKNAMFKELSPSSSGGAIYCKDASLVFLAEETSFLNCTPSGWGGAIYLVITGESVLSKICGFGCFSTASHNLFDYIKVSNDASKRNEVLDSSICRCVQASYSEIMQHNYGNVLFKNDNNSLNECNHYSAIDSDHQSAGNNEFGFMLAYSSIANNTAIEHQCIRATSSSLKKQISSCNVLMNKQSSTEYGIIRTDGQVFINNSCILGNVGSKIIYVDSNNGVVSNCTLDFTSSSVYGASITDQVRSSFINKIECFSSALCEAFYDSFGNLTVIPVKKTRKIPACTCKGNSPRQRAFSVI